MTPSIKAAVEMTVAMKQYLQGHDENSHANVSCHFSMRDWNHLLAALEALRPVAEGEAVIVPVEPTEKMLQYAASAMKDYIRTMPADEKERRWGRKMEPKNGYRLPPFEKHAVRYRAMIAAIPPSKA